MSSSPIVNPLVAAGLVPADLADILATPSEDAAASKKRTKRITGARELTANEYTTWLKEEEGKKKELAEEKEKERKRKKEEKEEAMRRKKAEKEEARKKKAAEKEEAKKRKEAEKGKARNPRKRSSQPAAQTRKKPTARQRPDPLAANSDSSSESDAPIMNASSSGEQDSSSESSLPHPKRQRQLPSRFRQGSDSSSDDEDGVLCTICNAREPTCTTNTIFWVDCEKCGAWVHSYCAFKNNNASRRYTCELCLTSTSR